MTNFDPEAPILPGVGVAGIALGEPAEAVLRALAGVSVEAEPLINTCLQAPTGVIRYRSADLDFWATDGVVDQVAVHGAYRGTLADGIGLGATLAEVAEHLGPYADDAGMVVVPGLSGVALAVAGSLSRHDARTADHQATIVEILVFRP